MSQDVIATIALVLSAVSLTVLAAQTWVSVRQTRILGGVAVLSYNVEAITRLEDVLWAIADDPASAKHVWDRDRVAENARPALSAAALADVLSAALGGMDRLPGYADYKSDWMDYATYVLRNSPGVRAQIAAHPEWWPELGAIDRAVADELMARDEIA